MQLFIFYMILSSNSKDQNSNLKKLLPKGTCLVTEAKKHEYINKFMTHPQPYKYVIPMVAEISSFVVIRTQPEKGNPLFKLYYHPTKLFLLSAQQQSMSIGCNYLISASEIPSKSDKFVGKLRGNFKGDQFQLYDNGDNPERVKNRPRKHLAFINCEEGSIFQKQKRLRMKMVVPKPQQSQSTNEGTHQYSPLDMTCKQNNPNPLSKETQRSGYIETLQMKKEQNYIGDIHRMVLYSSIKTESLVIGQKSPTFFELKIGCPLTVLQGFGYLLSVIQHLSL